MIIAKFFRFLLFGALHRQRGDRSNIYFSRASFWVSISTSIYITSILHLFRDWFLDFSRFLGEEIFSFQKYDGSTLVAGILTFVLFITFFFAFWPNIVTDFKSSERKAFRYNIFLLYLLGSVIAFIVSKAYLLDDF